MARAAQISPFCLRKLIVADAAAAAPDVSTKWLAASAAGCRGM